MFEADEDRDEQDGCVVDELDDVEHLASSDHRRKLLEVEQV